MTMKLSDDYTVDCELEVQLTVNIRVIAEGLDPSWFTVNMDGSMELTPDGINWFLNDANHQVQHGAMDFDVVEHYINTENAEWTIFDEDSREITAQQIPLGALEPF